MYVSIQCVGVNDCCYCLISNLIVYLFKSILYMYTYHMNMVMLSVWPACHPCVLCFNGYICDVRTNNKNEGTNIMSVLVIVFSL